MKSIAGMSIGELGAFVCSHLMKQGINVVLTGGACVSIYTTNRYQSLDLDFVENVSSGRKKIRGIMSEIGFEEEGRHFKHTDTPFFVEFPPGPLSIGNEPVRDIVDMELPTGKLRLLSPTDCVKDRLACYYHWNDMGCLEQALLVVESNDVDMKEIGRWSKHEGKDNEFLKFKRLIQATSKTGDDQN